MDKDDQVIERFLCLASIEKDRKHDLFNKVWDIPIEERQAIIGEVFKAYSNYLKEVKSNTSALNIRTYANDFCNPLLFNRLIIKPSELAGVGVFDTLTVCAFVFPEHKYHFEDKKRLYLQDWLRSYKKEQLAISARKKANDRWAVSEKTKAMCKAYKIWKEHPKEGRYKASLARHMLEKEEGVAGILDSEKGLSDKFTKWERGEEVPAC